jgi:hypothetical protein
MLSGSPRLRWGIHRLQLQVADQEPWQSRGLIVLVAWQTVDIEHDGIFSTSGASVRGHDDPDAEPI